MNSGVSGSGPSAASSGWRGWVAVGPVQAAEATWIVEPQATTGIEQQVVVIVRQQRRGRVEHAQAAGHAEMQDQAAVVQVDDQVLGAATDVADALAGDSRRQPCVDAPAQAGLAEHERGDLPPADDAAYAAARGLDFRKLGQMGTVPILSYLIFDSL